MREKTFSSIRPEKNYDIENIENGKCTVLFFDNIQEEMQVDEENNEKKVYSYDTYMLETDFRENLAELIEANIESWLNLVKEKDYNEVAAVVRKQRDDLLAATDWTQMKDTALSKEEQDKYKTYRQALRDIPEQAGFPYDIEWPVKEA